MNIKSASTTLGMTLLAAGLLITVPRANAAITVSMADKNFILAAAQGGMTEVKLGELAAQNGKRDDVKAFGQMMVKDHSAINDDLKALAAQKGVTLPDSQLAQLHLGHAALGCRQYKVFVGRGDRRFRVCTGNQESHRHQGHAQCG